MAATTYKSLGKVDSAAAKRVAYARLISLLLHLEALGVDLTALSINADLTVSVTLTGPLAADQLAHLGLA